MSQNMPKSLKSLLTVYTIFHGLIFAYRLGWGAGELGEGRGWGKAGIATKQSKNPVEQKHSCLSADCRSHRPLSILLELKDVRVVHILSLDSIKCK